MQIDYAYILCAGLGTRMGDIGKSLPKALWPVFGHALLELQIKYCHELGIKNIYINTHYLHNSFIDFFKNNPQYQNVKILNENPLLDSGGAIHGLARQKEIDYKGNVLVVNSDQFLFFNKKYIDDALVKLENGGRASLWGINVNKNSKYNETLIQNEKLQEIKQADKESDYITYSGLGIVKLDNLSRVEGPSKFFTSVANYKNEDIYLIVPKKNEYWDFGTADLYAYKHFEILKEQNSTTEMKLFLKRNGVDFEAISNFINKDLGSIDLNNKGRFSPNSLLFDEITQKIFFPVSS